ncbi:uncharacterized protein LOC105848089 [Hydra vulgaris]|uniref:uncharacterized protein LOC105848089 n=1 Tax=Hydra vulgaris TaxID=6087 RepID=UPI001F5F1641|nr:uncharacterized protein LOC105848089 [Hydra vulgaris]
MSQVNNAIWNYFTKLPEVTVNSDTKKKTYKSSCNQCQAVLTCCHGSTSGMSKHLRSQHPIQAKAYIKAKNDKVVQLAADREEVEKELDISSSLRGFFPATTTSKKRLDNLSKKSPPSSQQGDHEKLQVTLDEYVKVRKILKFFSSLNNRFYNILPFLFVNIRIKIKPKLVN